MAANCADSPEGVVRTSGLRTGAQAYSIAWEVDFAALPAAGTFRNLFYQGPDPTDYSTFLWIGQDEDGFVYLDINGTYEQNTLLATGKHHLAYVRSSATDHKMYRDGRLFIASGEDSTSVVITHQFLGTDRVTLWAPTKLSRVREWSVALTNAEIEFERLSPTVVKTANLICDAPFASDLLDDSGVGNHWIEDGGTIAFTAQPGIPTRFYPAVKAVPARVDGYGAGTWNHGPGPQSYRPTAFRTQLSTSKTDAGSQTSQAISCSRQPNYDIGSNFSWMSPPQEAQTVSGYFDLCFRVQARWVGISGFTNDSVVRYKVHVYITQGQTPLVRHTLLNNYVDSVNFPGTSGGAWRALAASQPVIAGAMLAGDSVMIEFGFRIVSAPTPTVTYPPDEWTQIDFRSVGANSAFSDAIPGDTTTSRAPWFEFSHAFVPLALPAAPATGTTCLTAIPIAAFPYVSADIDTTQAPGTQREMWFEFTAPTTGEIFVTTLGATYRTAIDIYRGTCGTPIVADYGTRVYFWGNRSGSVALLNATAATTYRVRVRNNADSSCASDSGGLLRVTAFYRQAPAEDDLYVPAGHLVAFREGVPVNMNPSMDDLSPEGVAIDYTLRSMANAGSSLGGDPHAGERLHVGRFYGPNMDEILDLPSLNYVVAGASDIDLIFDPFDLTVPEPSDGETAIAQLHIARTSGLLLAFFRGNGFLFVSGQGTSRPAFLDRVASDAAFSAMKTIDAIKGDNQAGAPFSATFHYPAIETGSVCNIQGDIDEATNTLYYVSRPASFGVVTSDGATVTPATKIQRYNYISQTQLADFATFTPLGGGASGLCLLAGGGLLLCNGGVIQRYNAAGALISTYTPSTPTGNRQLTDVRVTSDGLSAWTVDLWTATLYKFTLATMLQAATYPTYLRTARTIQILLYQSEGIEPPEPEPEEKCITAPESVQCLDPEDPTVACLSAHTPTKGATWSPTHDVDSMAVTLKDHH